MTWWQALIVALGTYAGTKSVDALLAFATDKREFRKRRRDLALTDIESLKDEVGILYELAANWKTFQEKAPIYSSSFELDHQLIGRISKYPMISQAARDTVHWCKIVAHEENQSTGDAIELKKELGDKYRDFLSKCDAYLDQIV